MKIHDLKQKELRPFKGFMCPGLYFSSGYCIWLVYWDSYPYEAGTLSEIWVFTPEGERICYVDPEHAGTIFTLYHNFNEVIGAHNIWEWHSSNMLHLTMDSSNSTTLQVQVVLSSSFLMNTLLKCIPGGIKMNGKTETGMEYMHKPQKIVSVKNAKATLNGDNLGKLISPPHEISVGDGKVPKRPILSFCHHYLEYV